MAKNSFFKNIDWLMVLVLTSTILVVNFVCAWLNVSLSGGLLADFLWTGSSVITGLGLYKLLKGKK